MTETPGAKDRTFSRSRPQIVPTLRFSRRSLTSASLSRLLTRVARVRTPRTGSAVTGLPRLAGSGRASSAADLLVDARRGGCLAGERVLGRPLDGRGAAHAPVVSGQHRSHGGRQLPWQLVWLAGKRYLLGRGADLDVGHAVQVEGDRGQARAQRLEKLRAGGVTQRAEQEDRCGGVELRELRPVDASEQFHVTG